MAITVGRAPEYRARRSVPLQIGGRYADLRPSRAENRAIGGLGRLLRQRGEEMKQERDAAVVGDLYNQWRDAERSALEQIGQKKGKDAIDLHLDYDKFYNETQGKADESTENGTQQRVLKDMLSRRRQQSLDSIASYEAGELQRYKQTQEAGIIANAEADIREASFDDLKRENIMIGVFDYVEQNNPGLSPEALEALQNSYQSQLLYANMQAQISEKPSAALADIEKWKKQLGEGYFQLKAKAEAQIEDEIYQSLQDSAELKFANDYDAQEDWVKNQTDIPQEIRSRVIRSIRAEEAEQRERENKVNKDIRIGFYNDVFARVRAHDYKGALNEVSKADKEVFNQKELSVLEEAINSKIHSSATTDDLAVKDDYWQEIELNPQGVDRVALIKDKRLTTGTKDWLLNQFDTSASNPKDPFRLTEAKDILTTLNGRMKNKMYDEDSWERNRLGWIEDRNAFLSWLSENPEEAPSVWFKERFKEELKPTQSWWKDLFSNQVSTEPYTHPGVSGTQPQKVIVRSGTIQNENHPDYGKRIVEYSDGSREMVD